MRPCLQLKQSRFPRFCSHPIRAWHIVAIAHQWLRVIHWFMMVSISCATPHWEERHLKSFCIEFNSYKRFLVVVATDLLAESCSPRTKRLVSEFGVEPESSPSITHGSASVKRACFQSMVRGRWMLLNPAIEKTP